MEMISLRGIISEETSGLFCSSIRPSALNVFMEMISLRGIISEESSGLVSVWIARGITRLTRWVLSCKSGVIPMVSSMYISTLPLSFVGMKTARFLAGWKETESERLSRGSSSSKAGQADPLKVIHRAINNMLSNIASLFVAVLLAITEGSINVHLKNKYFCTGMSVFFFCYVVN